MDILTTHHIHNTHRLQVRKLASEIKPCAIREVLHRRQYENHHSVIYRTVKHLYVNVIVPIVLAVCPLFRKVDRVLL